MSGACNSASTQRLWIAREAVKPFIRQHYKLSLDDKLEDDVPPPTQLPGFMVGRIDGSIYGLEQLVVDLNAAHFGWATSNEGYTRWDFVLVRNIDQGSPTVDVYAIPQTNERRGTATPYGFYEIREHDLQDARKRWHAAQGAIATYIEGWLAGRAAKK